eukprot:jgi/Tetstr1/434160/TSEL_002484.t1
MLITEQLKLADEYQKVYADRKTSPVEFAEGDKVWLSTEHLLIRNQPARKFRQRYIGPYPVTAKISSQAYRMRLPPTFDCHNVFHISRLRQCVNPDAQPDTIPSSVEPPVDEFVVERVLDFSIERREDLYKRGLCLVFLDDPAAREEREKSGEPLRVRPLGVGSVLVRLASAHALGQVGADAREVMGPVQRSFQSGAGCETAYMSMRVALQLFGGRGTGGKGLLLPDIRNAFNEVSRGAILYGLLQHPRLHGMIPFFQMLYDRPSDLYYYATDDPGTLRATPQSRTGVRHGDVLAPLYFCLAIAGPVQAVVARTAADTFCQSFADDCGAATAAAHVPRVFDEYCTELSKVGLVVQDSKTRYVRHPGDSESELRTVREKLAPGGFRTPADDHVQDGAVYLGAPISHYPEWMTGALRRRREAHAKLLERIASFGTSGYGCHHGAMRLLVVCAVRQTGFLSRMMPPSELDPFLEAVDAANISAAFSLLGLDACDQSTPRMEAAIVQMSMPADFGGLNLALLQSEAPAAFYSAQSVVLPKLVREYGPALGPVYEAVRAEVSSVATSALPWARETRRVYETLPTYWCSGLAT